MENKRQCPFIKKVLVEYCTAIPFKKMIPVDQIKTDSLCLAGEYERCAVYSEAANKTSDLKRFNADIEIVKGFIVRKNYYYHQAHTWVKLEDKNIVKIGIDDFASKLLNGINHIDLPDTGQMIRMGEPFAKVWCGNKSADIISPVNGEIVTTNNGIKRDVSCINNDPYSEGWLITSRTDNDDMKWLMHADMTAKWTAIESERLRSVIGTEIGITMTDGGEINRFLSTVESEEEWRTLVKVFLLNK